MRWLILSIGFVTGCRQILGFEDVVVASDASSPDDAGSDATAADMADAGLSFVPLHLTEATGAPGTADLVFGDATIDTGALTIGQALPPGSFEVVPQASGPDLAVLRVATLDVGGTVRVIGSRPLIVVAQGPIRIDGVLDASAQHAIPGAGGAIANAGPGMGGVGGHAGTFRDSGGGGAAFGRVGGTGGNVTCGGCTVLPGGGGGTPYGNDDVTILEGGSGGGNPAIVGCGSTPGAGAGGGAIQLSSATAIAISAQGFVLAGGGGGAGGVYGNPGCNWGAGAGGGSGGAIVLQSPLVDLVGLLAANGGGGGSAASFEEGLPGRNGTSSATPAMGGASVGALGGAGGSGGSRSSSSGPGETNSASDGNGGGGGGGVGRILVVAATFTNTGLASPDAIHRP